VWDCQASVVPCRTAFLTACSASCRGELSLTVRAQETARALMEQPGLVVPEGDDGHRGEALEAVSQPIMERAGRTGFQSG
jgi:hypothetical protein